MKPDKLLDYLFNILDSLLRIEILLKELLNKTDNIKKSKNFNIHSLILSPRAINVLTIYFTKIDKDIDSITLDDIKKLSEKKLRKIRNCGNVTIKELRETFKKHKITLNP